MACNSPCATIPTCKAGLSIGSKTGHTELSLRVVFQSGAQADSIWSLAPQYSDGIKKSFSIDGKYVLMMRAMRVDYQQVCRPATT